MLTVKEWKSRTMAVGHSRSRELSNVDDALAAYMSKPTPGAMAALVVAIEAWSRNKHPQGNGYADLLKGIRNKSGAVQQLVTDVRRIPGKPAHWPDATAGSTYVATLDEAAVNLLRKQRSEATRISVEMIAAMNVDWASFAFDQLDAASSTAINLGHTDFGAGWKGAQNNQTSLGQMEATTAGKILNMSLMKSAETLKADERVENVLKAAGLGINVVLGVLKFYLFKDGVMAKAVPLLGPLKEAVDATARGAVQLRLASNSFQRVTAAQSLIKEGSDAAIALNAFETLLKIETAKAVTNLAYRLLKDTALVVTEVLTLGAMTVVQVVTALVEVIVGFVYQFVYSLVFRKSALQCREWVENGASPHDLDFRAWIAGCPLLGAYFIVGLSAGGGAMTALSMFGQPFRQVSSTDFQSASVKLLKVRQAAAAYVQDSPVKVKWTGPNGEKYKWISNLIITDALSASVGPNALKIHHYSLSEDASRKTRFKHKFHEHGNNAWSLAKTAWSVI